MQGVVFLGDRKLALREFPDPAPGPRDVVLEIKASGMCGSDLHVYRASFKPGDTTSGFARGAEPVSTVLRIVVFCSVVSETLLLVIGRSPAPCLVVVLSDAPCLVVVSFRSDAPCRVPSLRSDAPCFVPLGSA